MAFGPFHTLEGLPSYFIDLFLIEVRNPKRFLGHSMGIAEDRFGLGRYRKIRCWRQLWPKQPKTIARFLGPSANFTTGGDAFRIVPSSCFQVLNFLRLHDVRECSQNVWLFNKTSSLFPI